jgi:5-methylcytosine-specific restriction endonuclease McrA
LTSIWKRQLDRPRARLLVMTSEAPARRSLNFGDSYTCTYCLQVIKWDHHRTRPTRDHFFPKSKKKQLNGVKTTFVICCQPCNSRKSDNVFSSIEEARKFITTRRGLRTNIDGN